MCKNNNYLKQQMTPTKEKPSLAWLILVVYKNFLFKDINEIISTGSW